MKASKALTAIVILLSVSLLAGCNTKFSYSFKEEQALGDWILEEYFLPSFVSNASPLVYALHAFVPDKGLELRQGGVTWPVMFKGDLTYKVRFYLKADETHPLFFSISMSDDTCHGDGSDLHLDVEDVGKPTERYALIEHEPSAMLMISPIDEYLPGLKRNGMNDFVLKKVGDMVEMRMNGAFIGEIKLENYASEWFAPNIEVHTGGYAPDGVYGLIIEKVEVIYPKGNEADLGTI
ncbi:MAG: hypothetical protein KBB09_02445 [Firmicutes bacterium]|nr:hypothetical protein [Bacillota bacterium]